MQQISKDELIGNFEAVFEEQEKASALRSQANEISKKATEMLNDFAAEIESTKTQVNDAYKRYKNLRLKKVSADDEDYYTLMTVVDEHFTEEEND